MLPYVKINFANGAIGGSAAMDDGCTGLLCSAAAVPDKFVLGTNYLITSLQQLQQLGIDNDSEGVNANVYKCVRDFYSEAPKGTKLYIRGVADTVTVDELTDPDEGHVLPLLKYANGEIRTLVVKATDAAGYEATIAHGLDELVYAAMANAQSLAEHAADDMKAPVVVLLEGRHYNGIPANLANAEEFGYNRVAVVIGDTVRGSVGAAVGLVAGHIAAIPVQRSIARVKDGAIKANLMFIGNAMVESGNPDIIHDRGFICPRTFVGKAGYYWSDDKLFTAATDDYCFIPRRRTIDKAHRIAYGAMLNFVNDEIPVTAEGKIAASAAKNIETVLESAIINRMTSEGNLATDPNDPNDTGVVAYVDLDQDIVATSHLDVQLRVRPYGYSKFIDVDLGFQTQQTA